MTTPTTAFISARNYTSETPIALADPIKKDYGSNYPLSTNNQKLVLIFPNSEVKPLINITDNQPVLVVSQSEEIMTVLNSVRSRLMKQMDITEAQMKPLLTVGKNLLHKSRSTLYINPTSTATLKDLSRQDVDYLSLVKKTCKMNLFLHIHSLFKNNDGRYSLVIKASQMTLLEQPQDEVVEVLTSEGRETVDEYIYDQDQLL